MDSGVAGFSATPACPALADAHEGTVQVRAGLDVHDHQLTTRLDPARQHQVRLDDHQMRLEPEPDQRAARGDDVGSERQVGHEPPVHHIPLDPVDPRLLQCLALVAETGEVGGQYRGHDPDRAVVHDSSSRGWDEYRTLGAGCAPGFPAQGERRGEVNMDPTMAR